MMRSIDTNVVLRLLLDDDEVQSPIARQIVRGDCLVLPTVIIEVVWAMSSAKALDRHTIAAQLDDFFRLPNLRVLERPAIEWALTRYANGADFADMLHLTLSGAADNFTTFDRGIAKFADEHVISVETLG